MEEIENKYAYIGGKFVTPVRELRNKLSRIKAFIFDWDGVFNNGQKIDGGSSNFSEVDSMGTNLLRYSHYMRHDKLPLIAIISGEKNDTAFYFCKREAFHYSFSKAADKITALNFICEKENIKPEEIAYFFDDVLDLSIAEVCGLRIMVNQKSNPLFADYCVKNNLVDYLSSSSGGDFAVRETTELLIGLNDNYDAVITERKNYSPAYAKYIAEKRKITTQYFSLEDKTVKAFNF
ncbi:MAG: phosphatase [Bacteroidetes bacterium]|nr:phosphatase [Bacteroidota bacterium]